MYTVKKAVTMRKYDLFVNGIHVLRDTKAEVNKFIETNVKPLGLTPA